jgi:hypothetical protein
VFLIEELKFWKDEEVIGDVGKLLMWNEDGDDDDDEKKFNVKFLSPYILFRLSLKRLTSLRSHRIEKHFQEDETFARICLEDPSFVQEKWRFKLLGSSRC